MKINPTAATPYMVHQTFTAQPAKRSAYGILAVCFSLLILITLPGSAQDTPRIQAFGGYSYLRFDSPTFGAASTTGLSGFNASIAGNLTREFGIKAELSGQYGAQMNLRDFVIGPQFLYPRGRLLFYGHGMFGKARTFVNQGNGVADTGTAWVVGVGVDTTLFNRVSLRIIQADYVHTHLLEQDQNNIRFSTGLVYHLGGLKRRKRRPPTTQMP